MWPRAHLGVLPFILELCAFEAAFGAASLTLLALGRRGLATGLAVVVLDGILMAVGPQ